MEFKSFMEALKGKQHKIDKNKNGKVDAHDFELLRKEETELEEATVKTQKYSWGTMKTVHHGSDFSIPLHPEHHQEIAKLKDQQEHKFKDETGRHWTAKRSGDDVHFQGANGGNSTTVKHSTMSESVEELDEIRRMKTKLNKLDPISNMSVARQKLTNLMKSGKAKGALIANKRRTLNMGDDIDQEDLDALHEVLSKDAKAGDYISDFVHSTNPKFEGKTKKERIKMALGAYYDTNKKKDGISEGRYQSHSGPSHGHAYGGSGFGRREREDDEYHVPDPTPVAPTLARKYIKGTPENKAAKAASKPINGHPTNEEVEEIEERNKENALMRKTMDASRGARYKLNNPVPDADPKHKTARDHNVAIGRALRNEDKMTTQKDKNGKLISFKYEGDWKKSTEKKEGSGKAANLAGQAMKKMQQANEQAPVAPVPDRKYIKGTPENLALKAARKPINGHPTGQAKTDDSLRAYYASKKKTNEEVEQIDELSDTTLDNYVSAARKDRETNKVNKASSDTAQRSNANDRDKKRIAGMNKANSYLTPGTAGYAKNQARKIKEAKDAAEYDQEGDMAKTQLRSIKYHADELHEMLSDNDNLPEWVQSKLTLAQDYLQTVCDYMYSKDEVNEAAYAGLEKEDKPGKIKTAVVKLHPKGVEGETVEGWKDAKKPVKESFDDEGNLISNKVSYKEFMLEYTPGPGGVTQIKGRSYGANYSDPEGADDADDNKPMKPAAEKRGRGRPAGAKSGARKITGTSKLMNK